MTKLWPIGIAFGVLLAGLAVYGGTSLWGAAAAPVHPEPEAAKIYEDSRVVAHKALYKIEMISKRSSAQVLNISGEMYFEWKPACDAWSTDHRFNLVYEYADSPPMRISSDFTTYEPFNGKSLDFNSRRRRDGELYEELRGHASLEQDGAGQALYTMPEDLDFDLPQGTLFPMAHTIDVLKAARAGKKFYTATIFDGSDDEGPAAVTAFIGKQVNAVARIVPSPAINMDLINTPAWQVRLAFFPLNDAEADSDYEMDVVLHDNGVISDMVVDYKDFSVTQKLVALETVTGASCGDSAEAGPAQPARPDKTRRNRSGKPLPEKLKP